MGSEHRSSRGSRHDTALQERSDGDGLVQSLPYSAAQLSTAKIGHVARKA